MNPKVKVRFKSVSKKYNLYRKQSDKLIDLLIPNKRPKEFYALRDISFEVYEGETIGIIGVNGSGKSTLSNLLAQVVPPSSGTIEINGETSLIAISAGLNNSLTGIENIRLKCLMLGFKSSDIEKLIPDIIEFADIGEFINQPVKNYSSGMKSRLGFAISVHTDPDILVIDEALSVGDETFYDKCLSKVNEFKQRGKTIFFISHSVSQIRSFTDRAIWINFGKIEEIGRTRAVLANYKEFIKWFNGLTAAEQKKYKADKLNEQIASSKISKPDDESLVIYANRISRSVKNKKLPKVDKQKKKNVLFKFQLFTLTLLMLISLGWMFIDESKVLFKENFLNFQSNAKEMDSKELKKTSKKVEPLLLNKNGRVSVENGILYKDKELKDQQVRLGFSSEVYIKEKIDLLYHVQYLNNEGYMKIDDVVEEETAIEPVDLPIRELIDVFPENFARSYQFFLAQLGTDYDSLISSLNGLTSENISDFGETVLVYDYYNLSIVLQEQKATKIITRNINTESAVIEQLAASAQFKSPGNDQFFIRTTDYDLILDLNENVLSIVAL